MPARSPFDKHVAAFLVIAMLESPVVAAAPAAAPNSVDPLAVVGLFGTADSAAAVCAGSTNYAAAHTASLSSDQRREAGCVLPAMESGSPSATIADTAVVSPLVPGGGASALPLLLGLAAVVAAVAVILNDKDGRIVLPIQPPVPVSP